MMGGMMRAVVGLALVVCLLGCGGREGGARDGGGAASDGGSTTSTCETLADPSLCWAVAVADLYACVPDETGVLSADRMSCSFSDGVVIDFGPLPLPTSTSTFLPNVTVRRGDGSECGIFYEQSSVRFVSANGLTATFTQEPGPILTLRCDGEVVVSDSFSNVVDCAFEGVRLPGWSAELDETSATLSVSATGQSGPLFRCVTGG